MATSRSTWKAAERRAARSLGAERQVGSGSGGRADQTRSDSTSKRLFLETKLRQKTAVRKLFDQTAELARREGKTPLLAIFDKGRQGFLLVLRPEDLEVVAAEMKAATETQEEASEDGSTIE